MMSLSRQFSVNEMSKTNKQTKQIKYSKYDLFVTLRDFTSSPVIMIPQCLKMQTECPFFLSYYFASSGLNYYKLR